MFIIPTGLLKEKSIAKMVANIDAVMVSKINVETFKNILSLKKKFTDFNFEISTWEDGFILELLKWFDNKIKQISNLNEIAFEYWKDYYEQIVRVLYYFVVYKDIQDSKELYDFFSYLFFHQRRSHIDKELMSVYNYLINKTPNYLEKSFQKYHYRNNVFEIDVLIGRWNNEGTRNRLENINNYLGNFNIDYCFDFIAFRNHLSF